MCTLVSVTLEHDGKKTDMYGANPQGQAKRLFKLSRGTNSPTPSTGSGIAYSVWRRVK
jgi:hypothetical protein